MAFQDLGDPQLVGGGFYNISSTQIGLKWRTGGFFDTVQYNAAYGNIVIWYYE
jgi:hypothetical protein